MPRNPIRTPNRRRPARLAAGLAVLTLGLTACGASTDGAAPPPEAGADPQQLTVVASTDAWGSVATAIGGDHVRVESIMNGAGQDPHGYEATPQDAATIRGARLVLVNGGGYDDFMTDLLDTSGGRVPVVDAAKIAGVDPGAGHAAGDGHDHGQVNEHVWYDPRTAREVGREIARQLTTTDPAHRADYEANARTFETGVDRLTSKAADIGRRHPGARVAVTEPVPGHLLDAAGLHDVTPGGFTSAVEEGNDPPAAVVAQTLDLFRNRPPVDALVRNEQTGSAATDQLGAAAEQAGVPVVEMSETLPEGVTGYLPWMERNLDALDAALGR